MSGFAIYDELTKMAELGPKTSLSRKYCLTINKLSPEHREIVYALIYHHHLIRKGTSNIVPYMGKIGKCGKGISYNVNNLPEDLQTIVSLYIDRIAK